MAKLISATGAKGLWSLLLTLNNMTPLSTNGGESPQITEANAAKGRKNLVRYTHRQLMKEKVI